MMFAERCVLKGRQGIATLDRSGAYAIIANRTLYNRKRARRFALVNTEHAWIDSIYRDPNEARSALHSLTGPA